MLQLVLSIFIKKLNIMILGFIMKLMGMERLFLIEISLIGLKL